MEVVWGVADGRGVRWIASGRMKSGDNNYHIELPAPGWVYYTHYVTGKRKQRTKAPPCVRQGTGAAARALGRPADATRQAPSHDAHFVSGLRLSLLDNVFSSYLKRTK